MSTFWTSNYGDIKLPDDFPLAIFRKDGWWDMRFGAIREKWEAWIAVEEAILRGEVMRCKQDAIDAGEKMVPRTCPVHGINHCRPVAAAPVPQTFTAVIDAMTRPGGITMGKPRPATINSDCLVYLAGPISGLSYDGAEDWRAHAKSELANAGIKAVSPLRGKEYLRGIMTRDRFDAMRCDILFVNLLGAERISVGTVMEIAWADAKRTPIVLAMEAKGNVHEHAMISEAIGFRVTSLMEAVHVVKAIADNR